jgi:hypothetical protein
MNASSTDQLFSELERIPDSSRTLIPSAPDAEKSVLKRGVHYTHQAMIDLIIERGGRISNAELALYFGYSQSWISTVMQSDAFQAAFAARREEIIDPRLRMSLEEQARGLYARSMEILREKLNVDAANVPDQLALQTFAQSARALGYGARPPPSPSEDTNAALIKHADNLVGLLRREKGRARAEEILDGQIAESPHRASGEASPGHSEGRAETPAVQPGVSGSGAERANQQNSDPPAQAV